MAQKAYNTCYEMFQQRKYDIIEADDECILAIREDGEQVCAFIPRVKTKFNVDKIQEYISILKNMGVNHCIIVYKDNVTPIAKKVVEESKDIRIELFEQEELQYNITKHILVPKHELLYKKKSVEAQEFKKKYTAKFPVLLKTDPIARFYAYESGDIIKVTRSNDIVVYRIVR